jgi:divalent metal cation (Fe/Co/Zn/Cd) transporter
VTGERRALLGSIAVSVFCGLLAVVWGLLSGARIILFDGAYALIGIAIAGVSLRVARAVAAGPTRRFPFGREALTPLTVVGQGVALAATLFYAGADAVTVIRDGGSPVTPGPVAVYGAVTGVLSLGTAWWLRRAAPRSDLVDAEREQWRADAVLSAVIVVGSLVALVLVRGGRAAVAAYVDPVLVLVACACCARAGSSCRRASRRPRWPGRCARSSRPSGRGSGSTSRSCACTSSAASSTSRSASSCGRGSGTSRTRTRCAGPWSRAWSRWGSTCGPRSS